jgi:hypothetical protein
MMGSMDDAIEIAHHHPGRLRLRSGAFGPEHNGAGRARQALDATAGVTAVTLDERTGSLLVCYEPSRVEVDALVGAVAEATGLVVRVRKKPPRTETESAAVRVIEAMRGLEALTLQATGGRMGLSTLIPATLAGLSAVVFVKVPARRLPRWDNLLYWSYSIFLTLHQPEVEARRAAGRR